MSPAPQRSRISGIRANHFGDVCFIDFLELKLGEHSYNFFIGLDACTNLVFIAPTATQDAAHGQSAFSELMNDWKLKPKKIVCDMAFTVDKWQRYWNGLDIEPLPTGGRTPWPNRAERSVQIMTKALKILWNSVRTDPETATVTLRALCAKAMMARNTQMLLAGKCPHEMAFGHRPPLLFDAETAPASTLVPDEVLPSSLRRDRKISQLAVDAYLKA